MHADTSDLRRLERAVCACKECRAWDAPRRKAQPGKHGPPVAWRGRWYHRMPSGHYRHAKGELLHRAIWKAHRGPIPRGCHIHHRDEDPGNNQLGNLVMLTPAEHDAEHGPRGFRKLGHEWRSQRAKQNWKTRTWEPFTCLHCGKRGTTPYKGRRKFCDSTCERRYKSELAITERHCAQCGAAFRARDPRRIYCGSACNDAAYQQRKRLQSEG